MKVKLVNSSEAYERKRLKFNLLKCSQFMFEKMHYETKIQ